MPFSMTFVRRKMESMTRFQTLDKAVNVALHANAFRKSYQLWVNSTADLVL